MDCTHANAALFAALAKAQAEIGKPTEGRADSGRNSGTNALAEALELVRPVFSRHGLSILQSASFDGRVVSVDTTLAHADGGWATGRGSCTPSNSDAQGVGVAAAQLRLQSLAALAGISQEAVEPAAPAQSQAETPITLDPGPDSTPDPDELLPATLAAARSLLNRATDLDALERAWSYLPARVRGLLDAHKDDRKARLQGGGSSRA